MTSNILRKILVLLIAASPVAGFAQGYTNPVIGHVADAGVMRWAGKYYLGGVNTFGDFFVSRNLTEWNRRVHVFDLDNAWTHGTGARNNQIHADDISYSEGLFHLLFSVNYWGDDRHIVHITHATSPNIEGPYRELRDDQWYENRIDPQIFCDDDGRLYLYMVKFTDGNTIWARPLNNDFSFAGDAVCQFSSQPASWETYDNRVAEGPFVIKYRGRYYMMYNANHTSAVYGNYRLGVCEAAAPMAFGPGGKYPQPVVSPQTEAVSDTHTDLLTFGSRVYMPLNLNADTIRFVCNTEPKHQLMMKIAQRGGCSVSLNNQKINKSGTADYSLFKVDAKWLKKGENIISVERAKKDAQLVALALYDMDKACEGELQLTPGQPNIVRGPNGWEWWLVYMANSAWRRSQYVDRIHFTRNRLKVDGITGANTGGAQFAPAMPVYEGLSLDSIPAEHDAFLAELTFSSRGADCGIRVGEVSVSLPGNMKSGVEHLWRVEKNCGKLTVWIDSRLVADNVDINPQSNRIAWIGSAENYKVSHIQYTPGWDEYAQRFSGWQGLEADSLGLALGAKTEAFKGVAASEYEFSVMFHNPNLAPGQYGVYAAYADSKNYVRAVVDAATQQLVVENCVKGKLKTGTFALQTSSVCYPDVKYTDFIEKQYRFDCATRVSQIELPRLKADGFFGPERKGDVEFVEDIASRLTVSWLDGDTCRPLGYSASVDPQRPDWQRLTFDPVSTRALRFINASPTDVSHNIYRIKATADFAADCQLRVERRANTLQLCVDDRLVTSIAMPDKPAKVGLCANNAKGVSVSNALYYMVKP